MWWHSQCILGSHLGLLVVFGVDGNIDRWQQKRVCMSCCFCDSVWRPQSGERVLGLSSRWPLWKGAGTSYHVTLPCTGTNHQSPTERSLCPATLLSPLEAFSCFTFISTICCGSLAVPSVHRKTLRLREVNPGMSDFRAQALNYIFQVWFCSRQRAFGFFPALGTSEKKAK